jgi:hypothetical protein
MNFPNLSGPVFSSVLFSLFPNAELVLERFLLTDSNALLSNLKPFDTLLAFSG